jgi:translation initiation factor 2 beta subunit (eIF-2beta)/eIF-5
MLDLGLEEDEIYGLLAQPILKEYTKRVKLSKSKLQDEVKKEEDILLDLIKENSVLYNELSTKLKMDDLENYPLSKNHFNQVLFNEGKTDLTNEEIQVLVLQKFAQLKEIGDKLSRFQNLLNIESKGVGKSLLDLSDRRTSIDKLFNSIQFKNINKLVGEFDEGELTPNTITGYALTNSIFAADDVIKNSNLMPYSTEEFKKLLKQYESITNKEPNTDQKYEVWKAIKAFIFSNYFDPTERTRIFFDGKDNKSLNTTTGFVELADINSLGIFSLLIVITPSFILTSAVLFNLTVK